MRRRGRSASLGARTRADLASHRVPAAAGGDERDSKELQGDCSGGLASIRAPAAGVAPRRGAPGTPFSPVAPVAPFLNDPASPFTWLYAPHTITGLLLLVAALAYLAFWAPPPPVTGAPALDAYRRRATGAAALVFLAYCALQLRDSLLLRPHPVVWRLVHGAGLLYLLGLVYLVVFPTEDARALLRMLVNMPGQEGGAGGSAGGGREAAPAANTRVYAQDCRVFTPGDAGGPFARVAEAADEFLAAHFLGWIAKGLLLRDWRLGWALSCAWELIEYSLQNVLPNFHECWWDHWVLDFALCNGAGLCVGMALARALSLRSPDLAGLGPPPDSPPSQLRLLLAQFTPFEFARYEWRLFSSARRFGAVAALVAAMETIELNAFALKYVLHLPPTHPLNIARLAFWFAMALPATREYYAYATEEGVARLGPNLWLALTLCAAEVAVAAKFAADTAFPPDARIPRPVLACWALAAAAFALWLALKFAACGGRGTGRTRGGRGGEATGERGPAAGGSGGCAARPGAAALMNALLLLSAAALAGIVAVQDVGLGLLCRPGGGGGAEEAGRSGNMAAAGDAGSVPPWCAWWG
jgi:phosphatidylserine synthase 2